MRLDLTRAAARFGDRIGVAGATANPGDFGWVQVRGEVLFDAAADCEANTQLYATDTAGQVDDAETTDGALANIVLNVDADSIGGLTIGRLLNPTAGAATGQGGTPTPPPMTRAAFVGWSDSRVITAAWFTAAGTNYGSPTEGTVTGGAAFPTVTDAFVNAYGVFAIPSDLGYPDHLSTDGFRQPRNAFTNEGTLIHGGETYIMGVSRYRLRPNFAGLTMTWVFT